MSTYIICNLENLSLFLIFRPQQVHKSRPPPVPHAGHVQQRARVVAAGGGAAGGGRRQHHHGAQRAVDSCGGEGVGSVETL